MSGWSGAVKIGDLSDFIAPSQACVVSLEGTKLTDAALDAEVGTVQLQPKFGTANTSKTDGSAQGGGSVKVSLHDCLACSGCVTSAETVLLQYQSVGELQARLSDSSVTVIMSLSPQSVTSLAALHGLQPGDCAEKLAFFLKRCGVAAVFDIGWARDVALIETAAEFVHRYRASQSGSAQLAMEGQPASSMDLDDGSAAAQPMPMLASACPGWVCYAEKTHGQFVLPHISSAKSPQAVMGTVIKQRWSAAAGLDPAKVYHCAVMPCYDKKLEAARDDFNMPGSNVPETDCVLATTELHDLLQAHQVDLAALPATPLDGPCSNGVPGAPGRYYGMPGGSGGYLEHVFRTAAKDLFGMELPAGPLPLVTGRNPDLNECSLHVGGRRVLHFAAAYGFRNIQGLMRKIKLGKCEYDYVEVMACPSGCLNGGGQMKPAAGQSVHQLLEQLEGLHHGASLVSRPPQLNASVQELYKEWVLGEPYSQQAQGLFHTAYHYREKTVTMAIADW